VGEQFQLYAYAAPYNVVGRTTGAFGAVYFLRDKNGTLSAVKTPRADRPKLADQAFTDEAMIWAGIPPHQSILRAYRVTLYGQRPYVHMQFVPPMRDCGPSLEDVLVHRSGLALPANVALTVAYNLAGALRHLETLDPGFVHGDVKPGNLLVDCHGQASTAADMCARLDCGDATVLLSDFGMSRAASLLEASPRFGDVRYLAPELLVPHLAARPSSEFYGRTQRVASASNGKSADVYAVGCTLFELLLGIPRQVVDLERGTAAWMLAEAPDAAVFEELRPDLPPGVAALTAQCLALDPRDRPANYTVLDAMVRQILSDAGSVEAPLETVPTVPFDGASFGTTSPLHRYMREELGMTEEDAIKWSAAEERAIALRSVGRLTESDAVLDELLAVRPRYARVIGSKALNYSHRVDRDRTDAAAHEAERWFRRAKEEYDHDQVLRVADAAGYAGVNMNLAKLLASPITRTYRPEALALATAATRLLPQSAKAEEARGTALLRRQDFVSARESFGRAADLDPSSAHPRWMQAVSHELALVFEQRGDADAPGKSAPPTLSLRDRGIVADTILGWSETLVREGAPSMPPQPARDIAFWKQFVLRYRLAGLEPAGQDLVLQLAPFAQTVPLYCLESFYALTKRHSASLALDTAEASTILGQAVAVGLASAEGADADFLALGDGVDNGLRDIAYRNASIQRALEDAHHELYQRVAYNVLAQIEGDTAEAQAAGVARARREAPNLRAALKVAIARGNHLFLLVAALDALLEAEERHEDRRQLLSEALDHTARSVAGVERDAAAAMLHNLAGSVAIQQRRWSDADLHFKSELAVREAWGDREEVAAAMQRLGDIALELGDDGESVTRYEHALKIEFALGNSRSVSVLRLKLGAAAQTDGQFEDARGHYERALDIAQASGDRVQVACAHHHLGTLAQEVGDVVGAARYYREALDADTTDERGTARTYHQLGRLARAEGDVAVAESYLRRALELKIALGDIQAAASTYSELGILLSTPGRALEAIPLSISALQIRADVVRQWSGLDLQWLKYQRRLVGTREFDKVVGRTCDERLIRSLESMLDSVAEPEL
jgi:serine/threonine protein kinase/Flp pilus assembly protein TadD